jgi:tetratricopeptide (TPR) repeat protein
VGPALISAAQRAEAQLDSGLLTPESRRRVKQLQKDVKMLAELERIRLHQSGLTQGYFDVAAWDPLYAPVFRAYGLDMEVAGLEESTASLARSAIGEHLVAALDNWASGLMLLRKDDAGAKAQRLLAVARQVDPDPWRNRLRDMVQSDDASDIEQLVRAAPIEELPRSTLGLLGLRVWMAAQYSGVRVSGQPLTVSQPIVEILRRAQRRFPADPWLNLNLAVALRSVRPPSWAEAIGFHRAVVALRPQSPGTHHQLAYALQQQGDFDEAIIEYRKSVDVDPEDAGARYGFGCGLGAKGDWDGAIAEYRKAIGLRRDYPEAHCNLGIALLAKGDTDGAIAEYREALATKQPFPEAYNAHNGLGNVLKKKGDVDGAIVACRRAIELAPNISDFHYNLGNALHHKGDVPGAIAEHQKAIKLNPKDARPHNNLGAVLKDKGDVDGAIVEYRQAIELDPKSAVPHSNLGVALRDKGNLNGAIAEYHKAIELDPKYATAHYNLGLALQAKGDLDGAIAEYRQAIDYDPKYAKAHNDLVGKALRMKGLLDRLPGILKGETRPADAAECVALAELCQEPFQRRYAASARFYGDAFTAEPRLAEALPSGNRYNAACAAALAGCGTGEDAASLTDAGRAGLRQQALDWLRADLDAWRGLLDKARPAVAEQMRHWLIDTDFSGVRGPDALAKLPEAERQNWQKLWADVADTLRRAADKPPQPKDGDKKP